MSNTSQGHDPFSQFKAIQREVWADFALNEGFTTPPAADLVRFAGVAPGEAVLDVGCGSGVVAVTAARLGAKVSGLDLTTALLDRARQNAAIARVEVDFTEGDAEALPYADGTFDVVLSQFGHMFAPRPEVAVAEMLRVLKPGGRIAFSTWPPEHGTGQMFALLGSYMPPRPEGAPAPAPPVLWGDPSVVRARLGDAVTELRFGRGVMLSQALSPSHVVAFMETSFGPLKRLVAGLSSQPEKLAALRGDIVCLAGQSFWDNAMHQEFLMTRATKQQASR
jgi:SAM-dependent methyltransferase